MRLSAISPSAMPTSIEVNVSQTLVSRSPRLDLAEQVMSDYIQPTICMFGILCNLLNLIILTRPRLKESPYTYLLGLAVSDLCVLVIVFVRSVLSQRIGGGVYGWQFFNAFIFLPFANMFSNSSIWITVFLTIERWISVKFPLKAKKLCTRQLARWTMVGVAVAMFVINIPRFFCRNIRRRNTNDGGNGTEYTVVSSSFEQSDVYKGVTWLYIVCIISIPCLVLTVLNTCLLHMVYKANKCRAGLNETHNENNIAVHISREQRRLTVTCVSIICLFLVCVTPSAVMHPVVALAVFRQYDAPEEFFQGSFYRLLRIIANLLITFNLSLNFVLYCFFNNKFYKTLEHVVRAYMYRCFKIDIPSRDFQRLPRSKCGSTNNEQTAAETSVETTWNCRTYRFSRFCDGKTCRGGAGTNANSSPSSEISGVSTSSHLIVADSSRESSLKRNAAAACLCPNRSRVFDDFL